MANSGRDGFSRDQRRLDRFNRQLSVISKLSRWAAAAWLVAGIVGFALGNVALGLIGVFMAGFMVYLSRF